MNQIIKVIVFVILLVFIICYGYAVSRSSYNISSEDLKVAITSLDELNLVIKQDGSMSSTLNEFNNNINNYRALLIKAQEQNEKDKIAPETLKELNNQTLNFSIIQNRLQSERNTSNTALINAKANIDKIKNQLEPTNDFSKYSSQLALAFGNLIIQLIWPLLILSLFLYLFISRDGPNKISRIFSPFKSVKVFSTEFVLNNETKFNIEETFERYRKQVKNKFDLWAQRKSLESIFRITVTQIIDEINRKRVAEGKDRLSSYRCTIHVEDLLLAETFYQLVDYIPSGGGRGRTKSFRFGMIGRVWRSEKSLKEGQVPTDIDELTADWGMTKAEAEEAGRGRQSFLCIYLRHESRPVGVIYFDAFEKDAFKPAGIKEFVETSCATNGLTKCLAEIDNDLRGEAPLINIYNI